MYFEFKRVFSKVCKEPKKDLKTVMEVFEWLINTAYMDGYKDGSRVSFKRVKRMKRQIFRTYEQHRGI